MLKVNVGLSRKLSRDFNSTGFSVNIEGEVFADVSDAEATLVRIQEFYDVAEESLARQIERYESDTAIASRDEPVATPSPPAQPPQRQALNSSTPTQPKPSAKPQPPQRASSATTASATNKQIQFLLNLGKRHGLATPKLEERIAEVLGRRVGLYELSKREAGTVLDSFTADSKPAAIRR
ncbi:hypothetical protein [Lacipirellula sp.]|uniref:hypothetical protein n=1 Tax=Lacipirellula sp. TaxID=2691419 RepID=UPI003D0C41BB